MPDLPRTTSASQLVAYASCPRMYFLRYVAGLEGEFKSVSLVLGSAIHGAVAWFFTEKIERRVPTLDGAEEVLTADLVALTTGEPIRWKEATPATLEDDARRYLRIYLEAFGNLRVRSVETPFTVPLADPDTGVVKGRDVHGYFDLLLEDGRVIELKTAAKSWNAGDLVRHLQVGAYAFAWNALHGGPSQVEVHTIVKLKREPRVDVFKVERGEADTRWWLEAAASIEGAIAGHHFPPSPSPLCHECEFQRACLGMTCSIGDEPPDTDREPVEHDATPVYVSHELHRAEIVL